MSIERQERKEDEAVERLVKAAGRRDDMPEKLRSAWETHFETELQGHVSDRRQRQRWLMGLACACLLVLVTVPLILQRSVPGPAAIAAHVGQTVDAVLLVDGQGASERADSGRPIRVGQSLRTGAESLVAIEYSGARLRLDADSELVFGIGEIELLRGRIYVDSRSGINERVAGTRILLRSGLVTVRNIGTQYLVQRDEAGVRSIVRQGAIEVSTDGQNLRAKADAGVARQVLVNPEQGMALSEASASGEDWQWIHALAPSFEIDGSTVAEFLDWYSVETGLRLEYASQNAEHHAAQVRLRGGVAQLPLLDSLELVLATTRLEADTDAGLMIRMRR